MSKHSSKSGYDNLLRDIFITLFCIFFAVFVVFSIGKYYKELNYSQSKPKFFRGDTVTVNSQKYYVVGITCPYYFKEDKPIMCQYILNPFAYEN